MKQKKQARTQKNRKEEKSKTITLNNKLIEENCDCECGCDCWNGYCDCNCVECT